MPADARGYMLSDRGFFSFLVKIFVYIYICVCVCAFIRAHKYVYLCISCVPACTCRYVLICLHIYTHVSCVHWGGGQVAGSTS